MASWNESIPIDEQYADAGDDTLSNMSVASSIYQYRLENGRTYHAYRDGQYWGPNDEQARSLDDILHHAWLLSMNDKLHLAPLKNPKRAIDIGTGTGTWAVDFADAYPQTAIIGTDLSPIQPATRPPNLSFEIDDCCSDWVYPKKHFDYIHIRALYGSVADWPRFYKECYDHLAPGGYLEQVEMNPGPKSDDGSIAPGDAFDQCCKLAIMAGEAFGKTLMIENFMHEEIAKAGFIEVVKTTYKWPIGAWSTDPRLKDLGKWNLHHWLQGLEGWTLRMFRKHMGVQWTYENHKKWTLDMQKALQDRRYHVYQDATVVYARKPSR